jgi:UDP-N-acetylglucosamine 1-carboxyvinyltransferase
LALQQMGAKIHVFDAHTGVFHGPNVLRGTQVEITDLRAGATLVLAALAAEGQSQVIGIEHVARGYEDMVGNLSRIGARISEVEVEVDPTEGAPPLTTGNGHVERPVRNHRPSAISQ